MDTTPTPPTETPPAPNLARKAAKRALGFLRALAGFVGTLFVIGFSLLPLAALLVALPAVSPNEAVLSDTVRPTRSRWQRFGRRVMALGAGLVVLVALFAFAIEVTSRLPLPPGGQLGSLAKKVLGSAVTDFLPDDQNPTETERLKGLLARQSEFRKQLQQPTIDLPTRSNIMAGLAEVNRELADWADEVNKEWIVPRAMLDERRALRSSSSPDPVRLARLEQQIGKRVFEVTGKWSSAGDLLFHRTMLQSSVNKPNADPLLKEEAAKELRDIEAQVEDRKANSMKLRVMLDPDLSPILAKPLWTLLPPTLVQHWPFVLLIVYGTDLVLLLLIGKVPLAYNLRYLWVRRRDTLLTAVVFTVVVALVVVLLAFVNGMYKLNETTGVPGNVLVLSEGSTDEIFSNLSRSDVNIEQQTVDVDPQGRPLPKPIGVQRLTPGPDNNPLFDAEGKPIPLPADASAAVRDKAPRLASKETYMVMNQPVPKRPGEPERRRLLQVRAVEDVRLAAAVHNISLYPGGKWFASNSVVQGRDGKTYLACTIGEGAAGTLGEDVGKRRLEPGDTFNLGDQDWMVTGVMNTQGTTYGSEIWTGVNNIVVDATGRGGKYTTLVLRMEEVEGIDPAVASGAMASYLQNTYTAVKLKAFSEPDYYKELTKTNESFLMSIVIVAVVMAVGGVFGVMNTMFASIAARIKEVGVMRILGFKRWQILIAFMLESLVIAFVGGLLGCVLGSFADGFEATSNLSGGQGGGKSVSLTMIVDYQILAAGMLFTLILGRLGGLVPALSAMRMEILDSLR